MPSFAFALALPVEISMICYYDFRGGGVAVDISYIGFPGAHFRLLYNCSRYSDCGLFLLLAWSPPPCLGILNLFYNFYFN